MGEPKKSRKPTRNKRIVLLVLGVSLGVVCRMLPPQYQGPCNIVARIVGLLVGVPS